MHRLYDYSDSLVSVWLSVKSSMTDVLKKQIIKLNLVDISATMIKKINYKSVIN